MQTFIDMDEFNHASVFPEWVTEQTLKGDAFPLVTAMETLQNPELQREIEHVIHKKVAKMSADEIKQWKQQVDETIPVCLEILVPGAGGWSVFYYDNMDLAARAFYRWAHQRPDIVFCKSVATVNSCKQWLLEMLPQNGQRSITIGIVDNKHMPLEKYLPYQKNVKFGIFPQRRNLHIVTHSV